MAESKKDLKRLLLVLSSSVLAALVIASFFIYFYSPSTNYAVTSILLESDVLTQLNYNDNNPVTGNQDRYVFDHIDEQNLPEKKQQISLESYQKIYKILANDKSIQNIDPSIENLFRESPPLVLTLYVHTESSASWQKNSKVFQKIQFAKEGNYYRIELHEMSHGEPWAYFNHAQVLNQVKQILNL